VAFSPDGKRILTGSGDPNGQVGEARMWDAATGKPVSQRPLSHRSAVGGVTFSPDGQTYLTVCREEACLWKTEDAQPIGAPMRHPRPPQADQRASTELTAVLSPDGKLVATGEDGTVQLWDAATAKPKGVPLPTSGPVLVLAFSPDSRTLLAGCLDGGAQLWD